MTQLLSNKYLTLCALFLVMFIDGLGQGMIFPVLSSAIISNHAQTILHTATEHKREVWYAALIAVYYLMWFLSTSIVGDWSDKVGRKKVILFCLLVSCLSFVFCAVAFQVGSIVLLLVSRFAGGMTSSYQAVAQAAAIDLSPSYKKTIYVGAFLSAVTLGMACGPLVGAFFQNSSYVSWFSVKTPFYVSALLVVFAMVMMSRFYKDSSQRRIKKPTGAMATLKLFLEGLKSKRVQRLLITYFVLQLGWAIFYVYTADYFSLKYRATVDQVGLMMTCVAIGQTIGFAFLPLFVRTKNAVLVIVIGFLSIAVESILFAALIPTWALYLTIIPATALYSLATTYFLSLFSIAVSKQKQGWMMGLSGSMLALAVCLGSVAQGGLVTLHVLAPYVGAIVCILFGLVGLVKFLRTKHRRLLANAL